MSHVTFPGLGLDFNISNVCFSINGFDVYWYGVIIAFAALIGIAMGVKNAKKLGVDDDKFLDVVLIGAIFALLCGRGFYVAFADGYEVHSIKEFLDLRGGGTAFYGVLIGALTSIFVVCKLEKIRPLCMLDNVSIGFCLGQGIGRWGNFMNQELFGTNTDLPWGMYSDTIERYIRRNSASLFARHGIVLNEAPVHPTFFYEFLWCTLGALLLMRLLKKRRFDGQMFLSYLTWNGIGRAFTETLRTDALFLGNIRISRLVCVVLALTAAIAQFIIWKKIRREGDDEYLKCYVLTEEWQEELKAIEAKKQKSLFGSKKADAASEEPVAEEPVTEEEGAEDPELDALLARTAETSEEKETEE